MPAGGAEEGHGFAETAAAELREETGAVVAPEALRPFGCLSRADLHTIEYENGDLTQCFAMCFWAERWSRELRADEDEVRELGFFAPEKLPRPLHPPTAAGLETVRRAPAKRRVPGQLSRCPSCPRTTKAAPGAGTR